MCSHSLQNSGAHVAKRGWVCACAVPSRPGQGTRLRQCCTEVKGLGPGLRDRFQVLVPQLVKRVTLLLLLLLLLSRFSRVQVCATPETAAHQAPLSLGFSRQEHYFLV